MTKETLDKANEIQAEMQKIIEANTPLNDYVIGGEHCEKMWKAMPLRIIIKKRVSKRKHKKFPCLIERKGHGIAESKVISELTKEEVELIFNYRLKRYHELKKQLEELKDEPNII